MAQMSFHIEGLGVSKISAGEVWLGFNIGPGIVYHWVGTGPSSALTNATAKPFDVPDDSILYNFENEDVNMKIIGGIFGWGRTNIKFAINSSDNSTLLYDAAPKAIDHVLGVNVVGMIPLDFTLAPAQFQLLHNPQAIGFYLAMMGFPPDTPAPDLGAPDLSPPDNSTTGTA
jgi:hypothetical protein